MTARFSETWIERAERFLRKRIAPGDRLLAAVSGGPDSVGLLGLLADELRYDRNRLIVGHVNHGIRAEAGDDAELVRTLCASRGLVCVTEKVDAPGVAQRERLSLEAAARRLRYESLRRMAAVNDCRWILTGHTRDDSAETVLLRMLGGAPWYEWTGIPARHREVLRPLIEVSRKELRSWVQERGFPCRDDPSNTDPRYLRSRLRNYLLQKQYFWNDERVESVALAGQLLWWALEAYRLAARGLAKGSDCGSGVFGLEIERILGYYNSLIFVPLEVTWAESVGRPEARLPSAIRRQIPPFLRGKTPRACLKLPEAMVAERRGGWVWLYRESVAQIDVPVRLGDLRVPERGGQLTLGFDAPEDESYKTLLDPRCLERELHLRSWRPGDRLKAAKRPTKKIADLLAEQKLDPLERARVLVLADELGPLLVIGGPVAERALPPADETKPLWVSWKISHET